MVVGLFGLLVIWLISCMSTHMSYGRAEFFFGNRVCATVFATLLFVRQLSLREGALLGVEAGYVGSAT